MFELVSECPFCDTKRDLLAESSLCVAFADAYPVSPGHTLVITRRHIEAYFDCSHDERHELWELVERVRNELVQRFKPDGFNVGFNAGVAAGQTVMHLHVHVIPRYRGDTPDPRGGVRGVIADKQKYDVAALVPAQAMSARESAAAYVLSRPLASAPFAALPPFVHGDDVHFERTLRAALLDAERADILSAFVQTSGVQLLIDDLRDALERGAHIRLLTGDYLGITSADALRMLLRLAEEHERFQPFFYETPGNTAFHPKSYVFLRGAHGVAYIGSSNLSRSALQHGVEWNLRLVSSSDEATFAAIRTRFERLLTSACTRPLSRPVIDAYEARAPVPAKPMPEARGPAPAPNEIQREALDALKATRRTGHRKGLVVLATGLGKTYLSAFDFKAMGGERALFVAHREEILDQAKDTWQAVFPDKVVGAYDGKLDNSADIVFASVQTLSRAKHLSRFAPEAFDYIVVDEFHHAAAQTYRKLLGHFKPRFLLGLTATPDRMDGRSLLELCDDNLVFRRDLIHGISRRLLVPFHYFGIRDVTDFEPIPWRSGRFDPEALTTAVATDERANQTLTEYRKHAPPHGRRALCFCCTTEHADFMKEFLLRNGIKAAAVHSGPTSDPRGKSLRDLKSGELEVICAVDVFNEGLDVPDINTILMLRPTESPVVFLQQLGRGLRRADDKPHVTVIDFIGNHRSFLTKPQALVYLLGEDLPPLVGLQKIETQSLNLPEGCQVDISIEAIDLLRSLVQTSREDIAVFEYVTFRDAHGRRPTATELFHEHVNFAPIAKNKSTWFHFVREQGDLTDDEAAVLDAHEAWFGDLLRTRMTKSYKMVALRALLDHDALFIGTDLEDNARASFEIARNDLLLYRELREDEDRATFNAAFVRHWLEMPLRVWARGESTSQRWFEIVGDRFTPIFKVRPELEAAFEAMTEEMVELRLHQHRERLIRGRSLDASEAPIILTVSHASMRPILRFDRARRTDIPTGPTFVTVDGVAYVFDFKKIAVNVVTREGGGENVLATLMRSWFGPSAGLPGTRHQVKLDHSDDGWRLERVDGAATKAPTFDAASPQLPFFADVQAACGALLPDASNAAPAQQVAIKSDHALDPSKQFVVRALGDSMNGGDTPIADGDLVLCEWARGASPAEFEGRAFLLVGTDGEHSFAAIKVPRGHGDGWVLESWNPTEPSQPIPAGAKLEPVARVLGVVREADDLVLWGEYDRDAIAKAFGSVNNPSWKVGHRDITVAGQPHTILMVTLRKASQTNVDHRYSDQFVSANTLKWDSQASTKASSLKGRRITGHAAEGRTVHLFIQYDAHSPFTYCGAVSYVSHEGEAPMHVEFRLEQPLPESLYKLWSR
jgi:superfamily II DNA or RNA helicase/diadenosine tetraphosphate (Ap4A) HIT family hydrolase